MRSGPQARTTLHTNLPPLCARFLCAKWQAEQLPLMFNGATAPAALTASQLCCSSEEGQILVSILAIIVVDPFSIQLGVFWARGTIQTPSNRHARSMVKGTKEILHHVLAPLISCIYLWAAHIFQLQGGVYISEKKSFFLLILNNLPRGLIALLTKLGKNNFWTDFLIPPPCFQPNLAL